MYYINQLIKIHIQINNTSVVKYDFTGWVSYFWLTFSCLKNSCALELTGIVSSCLELSQVPWVVSYCFQVQVSSSLSYLELSWVTVELSWIVSSCLEVPFELCQVLLKMCPNVLRWHNVWVTKCWGGKMMGWPNVWWRDVGWHTVE